MHTLLVDPALLAAHLGDPAWAVVDCRFRLAEPAWGRRAYAAGHLPGAVYAHLDDDLSGPVVKGRTGRHPLPTPEAAARTFGAWGIGEGVQVVAYDDAGGAIAARLWWMLRWLGHDAVAVLDGGLPAWQRAGLPLRAGVEERPARRFVPHVRPHLVADAAAVEALGGRAGTCLLDAREGARYRGEHEPIDPVAGHVPGARSAPFAENLDADGRFLPPEALRARFAPLLAGADAEHAVVYCGSGVTAAHDVLALAHAGLGEARLYAGSWSEWITDPSRPVATGPEGAPEPGT